MTLDHIIDMRKCVSDGYGVGSFLGLFVESGAKDMGSKPSSSPPLLPNETMFLQVYIALRIPLEGASGEELSMRAPVETSLRETNIC